MRQAQQPLLGNIGGANTATLFSNLIQPQQQVPMMNTGNQPQAQPAANPFGALITSPQKVNPAPQNSAFNAMFAPQPQVNPMFGGMMMMGGMGYMNPMAQMYGGYGSRMW